jgi:3'(2'), 5'-bisphosphate nucleotidase
VAELELIASRRDHELAAALAAEAGDLLMEIRTDGPAAGGDLGHVGDRRSHHLLVQRLAAEVPDDAVLSEEGLDDRRRLERRRVWIIDPLDGTREYREVPRTDWAVNVALVIDGSPSAGAVALPARGLALSTAEPPPPPPPWEGPPRIVVSRTRPLPQATLLRDALGGELVPLGSAGAKAMAVVLGEADVYAHAGGQYEWDNAAPAAVAAAAGLHVSRLDGSPLHYNQPDPWLPDLLICRPELAEPVLAALSS